MQPLTVPRTIQNSRADDGPNPRGIKKVLGLLPGLAGEPLTVRRAMSKASWMCSITYIGSTYATQL